MKIILNALALLVLLSAKASAEDGYDLWLRYAPLAADEASALKPLARKIYVDGDTPTLRAAGAELRRGLSGLLQKPIPLADSPDHRGAVIVARRNAPLIAGLDLPLEALGPEGFLIKRVEIGGRDSIVIAGATDVGALYGAFEFLRLVQSSAFARNPGAALDVSSRPRVALRLLNHWDNLNGFVERGYAGASLWDWHKLPEYVDPRYTDYARANASIGINGVVLNNVNADASILTRLYLEKTAAVADALRPYGMKIYLSARFSAPTEIGGLKTADPAAPEVRAWWREKAAEIYRFIPDFGGFLVKANSEGQPGPQDFGRTHADGANMLAEALAAHGGVVMWRAFVYSDETPEDRVKQAYTEFKPLDGSFHDNVLVQVKNGPLDFQPREPFHPLFGAMPETPLMMEFQITKEYLGFETHLVYLGPLYEEALSADTHAKGPGSSVADVIEGGLFGEALSGVAGVSNIGADRNWTGSTFAQANWYVFGRLAWDPRASAESVAEEWLRQTFSRHALFVASATKIMMSSREAAVDYMTPLGLAHLMATGHHYGPGPWVDDAGRADWNPVYYHRADKDGVGFDRGPAGSDAVSQYAEPLAARFSKVEETPDELLLWFHHLPWGFRMQSGATLWEELVRRYDRGVETVHLMRLAWSDLRPYIDAARFDETERFLAIQEREAKWWRDASIAYFQSVSGLPLPSDIAPPPLSLDEYKEMEFPHLRGY